MKVRFVCSTVLVVIAAVVSAQGPSLPVDWGNVAATPARRVLDGSIGKCICDLHADGCDPNCCCDTQCSASAKTAFSQCDREVYSERSWVQCYGASSAVTIIHTQSGVDPPTDTSIAGESAVCMVRNNYPSDMAFEFYVPPALSASDIATPIPQEWFTPPERPTTFLAGDFVPVLYASPITGAGWQLTTRGTGYLTQLTPADDGTCMNDATVKFMTPIKTGNCILVGSLQNICNQASTSNWNFMAITPPQHSFIGASSLTAVRVNIIDASTGILLLASDPTQAFAGIVGGSTASLASSVQAKSEGSAGTSRRSVFQATTLEVGPNASYCRSAVESSRLTITYDYSTGVARLINASVDLLVSDIVVVAAAKNTTINDPIVRFAQESVVVFKDLNSPVGGADPSVAKGTPGYIAGGRVEAGQIVVRDVKSAVSRSVSGFAVPHGRWCNRSVFRPVPFLHDVNNAGCAFELTEADLSTMCTSSGSSNDRLMSVLVRNLTDPLSEVGEAFSATTVSSLITVLGQTADSQAGVVSDWIPIQGIPWTPPTPAPYNRILRRCDNILVGLHYTFVVGRAGVEFNPQDVIVGAKVEPIVGSYTFRNDASPAGTAPFFFQFRVSFTRFQGSSAATLMRRVVPPPILPALDENVFYPFQFPGGTSATENRQL